MMLKKKKKMKKKKIFIRKFFELSLVSFRKLDFWNST